MPQHFHSNTNLIISVKEARKLLGAKANTLSDDQIRDIIDILLLLAENDLSLKGSKNV